MSKKLKVEPSFLRAAVASNSFNEESKTVEIVFATETEVPRRSWDGKWMEILDCSPKSVRLERLNAGGPVLNNHSRWDLSDQIGVVEKAWIEGRECKARIRFSDREEVQGLVNDVKNGIIRNVSVGYSIYQVTETDTPEGEAPKYRITDWEPMEISLVCIPADVNSGVRSKENNDYYEVEIISNRNMENQNQNPAAGSESGARSANPAPVAQTPAPAATPAPVANDTDAARTAAENERNRITGINAAVRAANIDDTEFVDGLISKGVSLDQARAQILDKLAEAQKGQQTRNQQPAVVGADEQVKVRAAIEAALLYRHDSTLVNLDKDQINKDYFNQYRSASLTDIARIIMAQRGAAIDFSVSKSEIAHRAMSTGDYPLILSNIVGKSLRAYYDAAPSNWKKIGRKRSPSDFKDMTSLQFGGSLKLEKKTEGGEYKAGTFNETSDKFKLETYGKMILVTREMLVNDDLSAFMRYTEMFGRGAAQTEAEIVWNLFTQNSGGGRKLSDGKNLFHADHNNLGTGAAMGKAAFTEARTSMMRQKGLKGEPITVLPKFLVVPTELGIEAKTLINSTITPGSTGDVNPFQGLFEVIEDVYLTDPKAWFIFADPATIDVVQYAYLNGQEGLYTEKDVDFKTDNLQIKVRDDFNATIFEHRGVYKNPGQA